MVWQILAGNGHIKYRHKNLGIGQGLGNNSFRRHGQHQGQPVRRLYRGNAGSICGMAFWNDLDTNSIICRIVDYPGGKTPGTYGEMGINQWNTNAS